MPGSLLSIMVRRLRLVVPVGREETQNRRVRADHQSTLSKERSMGAAGAKSGSACHGAPPPRSWHTLWAHYDCPSLIIAEAALIGQSEPADR